jgi:hypothetical protein
MGGTTHDDGIYTSRLTSHKTAGTDMFTHDADIRSGSRPTAVHDKLNPAKPNSVGKITRESFDSDAHPESVPIVILFDVTGSMQSVPRVFIEKLGKLMAILVKKGYIAHPHILFGAVGDAYSDRVPIQIGQYEAGNEMDEVLSLFFLEGGGGAQQTESYELAAYFVNRYSDLDSVKKRGKKGYMFILGDETPYTFVNRTQVEKHIGEKLQSNMLFSTRDPRLKDKPLEDTDGDLLSSLEEKFEVFWILPGGTQNYNDNNVIQVLQAIFSQHFIKLPEPEAVCELIATTIGVCEGIDMDTVKSDLADVGADSKSINSATSALVPLSKTRAVGKTASLASGELVAAGRDDVARL